MSKSFSTASSDHFFIRSAQLDDAQILENTHEKIFHHRWDALTFANLIKKSTTLGFVAYLNYSRQKSCIGFLFIQLIQDEAEILTFGVLPKYQNKTIGWRLLNTAFRILNTKGCQKIFLEVDENNKPAIRLYEKFGFCKIGCRQNYYQTPNGSTHALLFQCDLGQKHDK